MDMRESERVANLCEAEWQQYIFKARSRWQKHRYAFSTERFRVPHPYPNVRQEFYAAQMRYLEDRADHDYQVYLEQKRKAEEDKRFCSSCRSALADINGAGPSSAAVGPAEARQPEPAAGDAVGPAEAGQPEPAAGDAVGPAEAGQPEPALGDAWTCSPDTPTRTRNQTRTPVGET